MVSKNSPTLGLVYIFSNPAMPGLVKIGHTKQLSATARLNQLSAASGVPLPFEECFSFPTEYPELRETEVHQRLERFRLSKDREFFRIEAFDAMHYVADVLWSGYHLAAKPNTFDLALFFKWFASDTLRLAKKHPERFKHSKILEKIQGLMEEVLSEENA